MFQAYISEQLLKCTFQVEEIYFLRSNIPLLVCTIPGEQQAQYWDLMGLLGQLIFFGEEHAAHFEYSQ
ncbi:hypothetical protein D3C74_492720 [compost metagenome]